MHENGYNLTLNMSARLILPVLILACLSIPVTAQEISYSASLMGPLGLNVVPSARMDKAGTISGGISTLDPYLNGYLGFQIADPLFINLRQSAEVSNINEDAERLYPGIDLKLRVLREGPFRPEISIGMQSAIGHKRMAGEYIALSKRWGDFDFTGGLGWGRMGSAGHFKNPLKAISKHFGESRNLDGEMPNEAEDWFTGEEIGVFGGVEYFTALDGLSLKADWGADDYAAERAAFDFSAPAPWSVGLSYSPYAWINAGLAAKGTDKIMARLSFKTSPAQWPWQSGKKEDTAPMRAYRTALALPAQMQLAAHKDGVLLYDVRRDIHTAEAAVALKSHQSAPYQIGIAAKNMANHAGPAIEQITVYPSVYNLRGSSVTINRRDLEQAMARHQGSADEIWANARFNDQKPNSSPRTAFALNQYQSQNYSITLDTQASLAEEDSGTLYRSSIITDVQGPDFMGLLHTGTALRLNIADNLHRIAELRPQALLPVRSNAADFAANTIGLDRAYTALTHSFTPEFHDMAALGYLEEMYAGAGGEILYRPFGARYALGAESWLALKRDPLTDLNLGYNGDRLINGHLNGWYEFPQDNLTASLKLGRYLAEDLGGTFGLAKTFDNGARLEGFATYSNTADFDLFGGTTHAYHGVQFSLPLGSIRHVPEGSALRFKAEPFGRDSGQSLDAPIKLYEVTAPFSQTHLAQKWHEITE